MYSVIHTMAFYTFHLICILNLNHTCSFSVLKKGHLSFWTSRVGIIKQVIYLPSTQSWYSAKFIKWHTSINRRGEVKESNEWKERKRERKIVCVCVCVTVAYLLMEPLHPVPSVSVVAGQGMSIKKICHKMPDNSVLCDQLKHSEFLIFS